jgi:phenylacetate-CoA ligase
MIDLVRPSRLPIYHYAIDWDQFFRDYLPPDTFAETVYRWPHERIRALQNERFMKIMEDGWRNGFYQERWRAAGLTPQSIRSLADIHKLPLFNSDDIKVNHQERPPFGTITGIDEEDFRDHPYKMQTSGGTTGKARATIFGVVEWEMNALSSARGLYIQGARPGDVMQIPATCSLANIGWAYYKASHDYLGILPLTTGSGVVTPSRRQIEIAFDYRTNLWISFPEYLTQLAKTAKDEFGRDVRELNTKLITTFLGPDLEGTLRRHVEDLWGTQVYDNYGTNEIGLGGFECPHKNGLHFMEDLLYFEILDTETNQPAPFGKSGNLVVTSLYRRVPPIIRFNLRDLGRLISESTCECGSSFRRMDHFLGRSDDMCRIKGVNVYPMACLPAIKSDPRTTGEWICVAERIEQDGVIREDMTVQVEVRRDALTRDGLREHLESRLKNDLGLKVSIELVDEGSLMDIANYGREGKARRLLDRRDNYKSI